MNFIDKTVHQTAGHVLVNSFLTSRWDAFNLSYSLIGYEETEFRNHLKARLRQRLLQDQSNLCCYCMRIINESETTLEHIVPKSTKTLVELNQYTHHAIIQHNVCLQSEFDNSNILMATPPFPLEIAYDNLTASCNGIFPGGTTYYICNHKRQNNLIEPLFYVPTIHNDIIYQKAGLISSTNSTYNSTIITLNLNYNSLEKIRQVWYHLSAIPLADILASTTEALRNQILVLNLDIIDIRRKTQLINDFKNETFWNILLQYQWFHNYYLSQYPIATR